MPHPIMFDEDDDLLARVRAIALALPGSDEKVGHGRPAFFTVKVFCWFGGSQRVDGEWVPHDRAILVQPDPGDEPALRADPRFWVPAYLGPAGWLGLDIADAADWREVAELIDASYRVTAPARLVRQLDAGG
ncbi:MmcQ/YjbR family DNA-binding protein [Microbacterium terricola]|uniref:Phosphoribosylglycinamide formyltransferase n=1 Tax=Microbacterium terricola TaxID=344163 RepID=A0ABM8E2B8_9MICO|nr:MmcQ/YjbR family DNA-binding protein [Microbacterium terricola]UYK40187.1 MmcQ/YjbR family DNA-binding protein [Microbacterium terricola]BDV32107.1 phosphoribosylglycinamide formyltransferase [Microbacterium terricola]